MTELTASPRDVLAQRLRELTRNYNVREVNMFGGLSFMVDERMAFAAGRTGDLLVHTNPADYDELIHRGATPAHMGNDRPMGRAWLSVPRRQIQEDAELAYWIEVGIHSQPPSS